MMKFLFLFLSLYSFIYAEFDYRVENTNFTIGSKDLTYNYDRLRFRTDYYEGNLFVTLIADGVNYLGMDYLNSLEFAYLKTIKSDTPFKTQSEFYEYKNGSAYLKLYRLYGGYEDDVNRIVVGLQNISMGVGRIWTPTNLFNPKNIYALEPDETFGVGAIVYTRHIGDRSNLTVVMSQKEDNSIKYGASYKTMLETIEIGISAISSNETKMLGFELEANVGESGIEVRSEVALIQNSFLRSYEQEEDLEFVQAIVGADYGFINGVTLIVEALYSSQNFTNEQLFLNLDSEILPNLVTSKFYTALSASYSFNIFLDGSLTYIESYNDENSRFVSPTLSYTFNDYNTFIAGAQIQDGNTLGEFGTLENRYFFKWSLSF